MKELIFTKFLNGIRWNFIESIIYRGIFLIHHLFLFKILDTGLYGFVGTVFSSLYLTVALANFGLDHSIGIFYETSTKSKHNFKYLFLHHLWGQLYIFTIIACLFVGGCTALSLMHHVLTMDITLACIVALILISEGIKKTVRSLLQYAFLNKITSTIEVAYLLLYVLTIWGSYGLGITLSAHVLCLPFLCMSLLSTCLLTLYLYKWYQELPDHADPLPPQIHKRFINNRILNTINNIGRNVFTNNFLVALFAFKYGLQQAAGVKVLGTISGTLASLIYKTFSRVSNALLSHTKHLDISEKQKAFSFLTHTIHQGIYCSAIFLIINYSYIIISLQKMKYVSLSTTLIFLLLAFPLFEHLFIAYERFYITEEKTRFLIGFNIIATGSLVLVLSIAPSSTILMIGLLAIRVGVFCMMSFIAYSYWNIRPNWKIQPKLLGGSIIASSIFFVLFRYSSLM